MTFNDLSLIEPILKALQTEGYSNPTPIQQQAIPHVLRHKDLLGCAQTGTGKTAAFAIPILQLLYEQKTAATGRKPIRALALTPTRELALQISESFTAYGRHTGLKNTVIFGGVSQKPQEEALKRGTDILVATPGRLLDLMNQGFVSLVDLQFFVLDEADRMLDMGFIHDVKKVIAKLPAKRQTLFFSATMPPEIASLADSILSDPEKVAVTPISSTAEKVAQSVYFVDKPDKPRLLAHLLQNPELRSTLVFTRTKHGADRVARDLVRGGFNAAAIHGNKAQNARQSALNNFKTGRVRVLVATDIAARGIDVEELSHVVNFDLPNIPETYVHRIGRTGRAGNSGIAISFCQTDEVPYLTDIQKLIGRAVPIEEGHPFAMPTPNLAPPVPIQKSKKMQSEVKKSEPPSGKKPGEQRQNQSPKPQNQPRPDNRNQPTAQNAKPQNQPRPETRNQPANQNPKPGKPSTPNQTAKSNNQPKSLLEKPIPRPPKHKNNAPKPAENGKDAQTGKPEFRKKKSPSAPVVIKRPPSRWDFLSKRIEINVELDDDFETTEVAENQGVVKPTQPNPQPRQQQKPQPKPQPRPQPQAKTTHHQPAAAAPKPVAAEGDAAASTNPNRRKKRWRKRGGNNKKAMAE